MLQKPEKAPARWATWLELACVADETKPWGLVSSATQARLEWALPYLTMLTTNLVGSDRFIYSPIFLFVLFEFIVCRLLVFVCLSCLFALNITSD